VVKRASRRTSFSYVKPMAKSLLGKRSVTGQRGYALSNGSGACLRRISSGPPVEGETNPKNQIYQMFAGGNLCLPTNRYLSLVTVLVKAARLMNGEEETPGLRPALHERWPGHPGDMRGIHEDHVFRATTGHLLAYGSHRTP
jgi:hypothetical protein